MSVFFRILQYLSLIAFGLLTFFSWYCFFCVYLFDIKFLTFAVSLITVEFALLFTLIYPIVYWFNHSIDMRIYDLCMYAILCLFASGVFASLSSWIETKQKRKNNE